MWFESKVTKCKNCYQVIPVNVLQNICKKSMVNAHFDWLSQMFFDNASIFLFLYYTVHCTILYLPFIFWEEEAQCVREICWQREGIFAHIPKTFGPFITHTRVSYLHKTWTHLDLTPFSVDLLPLTYVPTFNGH